MNILLFSKDESLARHCQDVLSELWGPDSKLAIGVPGQRPAAKDLCLWDFIPGGTEVPQLPGSLEAGRHLFLAHREDLRGLREHVGGSNIKVLLKPIAPSALRAFLADAYEQMREHDTASGNMHSLRLERDEMLQFLIQANLKLQEYDQERTNFLARSIHDFQAPLTAIGGYCGLLLEEELGRLTADQRDVLERMLQSATRLARIVNSMFQLSVPQSITKELTLQMADMRECVDRALHEVAVSMEEKRISVRVEVAPAPDGLFFDPSKMEQTLVNLLDNARRFTPRNGTIEIRGYQFFWERRSCRGAFRLGAERRVTQSGAPNSFRIDICDSGPGIPQLRVSKIFEEFSSYSGGHDRSGGGLGLAICRMILQQHQGRVWAESHPEGAVFSFVLPVQPNDARSLAGPEPIAKERLAAIEEVWS